MLRILTREISVEDRECCFRFGVIWSISRLVVHPLFNCSHKSSSATVAKLSGMGLKSSVCEQEDRFTTKSFGIALKLGVLKTSPCVITLQLSLENSSQMLPESALSCEAYIICIYNFEERNNIEKNHSIVNKTQTLLANTAKAETLTLRNCKQWWHFTSPSRYV